MVVPYVRDHEVCTFLPKNITSETTLMLPLQRVTVLIRQSQHAFRVTLTNAFSQKKAQLQLLTLWT